jgi:hypothetical protein
MTDINGDATRAVWHVRREARPEPALACADAARLLDVPPAALRTWSQRLAFPCDIGGPTGPRFRRSEIEALRDALPTAHSVTGAIHAARLRVDA